LVLQRQGVSGPYLKIDARISLPSGCNRLSVDIDCGVFIGMFYERRRQAAKAAPDLKTASCVNFVQFPPDARDFKIVAREQHRWRRCGHKTIDAKRYRTVWKMHPREAKALGTGHDPAHNGGGQPARLTGKA